jgi:hypothetical protein
MHDSTKTRAMPERSLFTERERAILAEEAEVKDNYRYKVKSTARQRIRRIDEDLAVLRDHHPEIFEMLRKRVCDEDYEHDE